MSRYYGYGNYPDPSELRQAAGGNAFYNPYSKYPNWGGGISQILQQIAMMQQMKKQRQQEEEQQTWERGIKERQVAAQERAAEPQPKSYEYESKVNDLVAAGWPRDKAVMKVLGIQTPEDLKAKAQQIYEEAKAKAKGEAEVKPPDVISPTEQRLERQSVLRSVQDKLQNIQETILALDKGQIFAPLDVGSLVKSKNFLTKLEAKLLGKKDLTDDEWAEFARISANPEGAFPSPRPGGEIGQTIGGNAPDQFMNQLMQNPPDEVFDYISKNPDVSIQDAIALYLLWKQQAAPGMEAPQAPAAAGPSGLSKTLKGLSKATIFPYVPQIIKSVKEVTKK